MTKEKECMKALQCLYLEVPSVIADDVKQKVIDALNEVKNCTIPDVMQRSELLFAFVEWWLNEDTSGEELPSKQSVEKFLANNSA